MLERVQAGEGDAPRTHARDCGVLRRKLDTGLCRFVLKRRGRLRLRLDGLGRLYKKGAECVVFGVQVRGRAREGFVGARQES